MASIDLVLFDIGGVLGSNGWDREQRDHATSHFAIDAADFQYRHEETVGALETGHLSLDEYLDVTVFWTPRPFDRDAFKTYMLQQSVAWPASIAVARALRDAGAVRLATLNNESEALNHHRIAAFGLREIFPTFFTSCWMGVRKPIRGMYERALGMTQADPARTVFIDDREQNLRPARDLGLHTIHYQDAPSLRAALAELHLL
ncbi:MAG TPA: HAD-IA family hydrolase [Gemmatimonadaceae bacterium]|nr:HAD-IA family hydrolase [Gemmatimonadaceae bacterium]